MKQAASSGSDYVEVKLAFWHVRVIIQMYFSLQGEAHNYIPALVNLRTAVTNHLMLCSNKQWDLNQPVQHPPI